MDNGASAFLAAYGVILVLAGVVFSVVLVVAWIILPFALIGTKPLLRELIRQQQKTNELLVLIVPPSAVPPPSGRILTARVSEPRETASGDQ